MFHRNKSEPCRCFFVILYLKTYNDPTGVAGRNTPRFKKKVTIPTNCVMLIYVRLLYDKCEMLKQFDKSASDKD